MVLECATMLLDMANAQTVTDFTEAVEKMQASDLWASNSAFRGYVSGHWLPAKEMWETCFRPELPITTNNGTETQSKMLREYYLKGSSHSLFALLEALHTFLATRGDACQRENLRCISAYRLYQDAVAHYLHDRPCSVVKHVMRRLDAAADLA